MLHLNKHLLYLSEKMPDWETQHTIHILKVYSKVCIFLNIHVVLDISVNKTPTACFVDTLNRLVVPFTSSAAYIKTKSLV